MSNVNYKKWIEQPVSRPRKGVTREEGTSLQKLVQKLAIAQGGCQHSFPEVIVSYGTGSRKGIDDEGQGQGLVEAVALQDLLFQEGIPTFSGLNLEAGYDWEVFKLRIKDPWGEKKGAKILLALLSRDFYSSRACLDEVCLAVENDATIIPLRMEIDDVGQNEQWSFAKSDQNLASKVQKVKEACERNSIPSPGCQFFRTDLLPEHFDSLLCRIRESLSPKNAKMQRDVPKLIVVGRTGVGKSSLVNHLKDKDGMDAKVSRAFKGTTKEQTVYTCTSSDGKKYHIVDIPGIDDADVTPEHTMSFINRYLGEDKFNCALILNPIGDRFNLPLQMLSYLFSEGVKGGWSNVFVIGTKSDKADREEVNMWEEAFRETFKEFFHNDAGKYMQISIYNENSLEILKQAIESTFANTVDFETVADDKLVGMLSRACCSDLTIQEQEKKKAEMLLLIQQGRDLADQFKKESEEAKQLALAAERREQEAEKRKKTAEEAACEAAKAARREKALKEEAERRQKEAEEAAEREKKNKEEAMRRQKEAEEAARKQKEEADRLRINVEQANTTRNIPQASWNPPASQRPAVGRTKVNLRQLNGTGWTRLRDRPKSSANGAEFTSVVVPDGKFDLLEVNGQYAKINWNGHSNWLDKKNLTYENGRRV